MSERAAFTIAPGVCWECGCTETTACWDPGTGEPCAWENEERTFCSVCALRLGDSIVRYVASLDALAFNEAVGGAPSLGELVLP